MIARALAHVRKHLTSGLLLVLPLLITLWLLGILLRIINENVTPWVLVLLDRLLPGLGALPARLLAPLVGLVLLVAVIYLAGLLVGNLVGRTVFGWVEAGILRIPLIKAIYGSARQLLEALRLTSRGGFSKVVLVEFPRAGSWIVGFVTRELEEAGYVVFLPTTPNPTSGWLLVVPRADVRVLDLSVEEGIKLVVSGGIVMPAQVSAQLASLGGAAGRAPLP